MLELAREKGARFLLTSTSECYGDPLVHPQVETYWGNVNPVGPRSCYDESKRFAEALTMAYHRKHGVAHQHRAHLQYLRPAHEAGRRARGAGVSRSGLRGEPMTVFGDGSQTRSFCYVSDLVDGLYRLMHSDERYPVNLGNPREMTILEFAEQIRGTDRERIGDRLPAAAARTIRSSASPTSRRRARCSAGSRGWRSKRACAHGGLFPSGPACHRLTRDQYPRIFAVVIIVTESGRTTLISKAHSAEPASRPIMDNQDARKLLKLRWSKPEDLEIYRTQLEAFRKKFGRDMGPEDPFFFDPDADSPQFRPPHEIDVAMDLLAMLMGQAGIDAAAIYAFKKTGGMFPIEKPGLSPDEISEWDAAIQEYNEKLRKTGTN